METVFFLSFAGLTIAFALVVVIAKNPVHGALSLMACFVQIAALFILLRSPFLAVVQIFVYVGTIMVIFVFVMMMLDIRKVLHERFVPGKVRFVIPITALLGITMVILLASSNQFDAISSTKDIVLEGTTFELGTVLFTDFLLPFEVVSVILLVALIGAILMAKKDTR
jgi:NADH-quinone oxidoreductase subunit J